MPFRDGFRGALWLSLGERLPPLTVQGRSIINSKVFLPPPAAGALVLDRGMGPPRGLRGSAALLLERRMAHSRGLRALASDDVLLADGFLGPVLVVGGEGDHGPAVVPVQDVHALDVDPGVL